MPKYLGWTNRIAIWPFTFPGRGSGNSRSQVSCYQRITVVWQESTPHNRAHLGDLLPEKDAETSLCPWEQQDREKERQEGPAFYKEV